MVLFPRRDYTRTPKYERTSLTEDFIIHVKILIYVYDKNYYGNSNNMVGFVIKYINCNQIVG